MEKILSKAQLVERSLMKKFRKSIWTKFILALKRYNLVEEGDKIAVCVSGGKDSMLLAKLFQLLKRISEVNFEVVYLSMNPGYNEANLNQIKNNAEMLEIPLTIFETNIFDSVVNIEKSPCYLCARMRRGYLYNEAKKLGCNKIALAHHTLDQAETILMHIFRGAGTTGAIGMTPISEGIYVRPFLNVTKEEIYDYLNENHVDYVEDYTNEDISYNRNFVRNVIMKDICSRWPNAVQAIVNFGLAVKDDDEFINKQIYAEAIINEDKAVKIPSSYFLYDNAIVTRIIFKAVKSIGITHDIEKKHVDAIKNLALNGENGKRISLPFEASVAKEYDYITIFNKHVEKPKFEAPFKCGEFDLPNGYKLVVKRVKEYDVKVQPGQLILDNRKVPKDAIWRFRQDGDVFAKFGGGSKKLKSYLIDKKIPLRVRDSLPVLAYGNEVYAIAGVEISDKVKVENVPTAYLVELKK